MRDFVEISSHSVPKCARCGRSGRVAGHSELDFIFMGVSPFGLIIQPPVSPQQTARIEKSHCPQHFLDLRPLPQRQGWLRTYFDIWGKAPGETFSPEEFTARKPRWNQWATDRGLGVDPQQSPCRAIHKSDHPVDIEQDAPLPPSPAPPSDRKLVFIPAFGCVMARYAPKTEIELFSL